MLLLVFIGLAVLKQRSKHQKSEGQIKTLEQEIVTLQNQSFEAIAMIKYLKSDEFVEKEARQKLNMAKQGEKVVIVPADKQLAAVKSAKEQSLKKNWQLWLEYFFGVR